MMTMRFSGLVCVALAMFALPAAAQTPDGITPADETICDEADFVTPGLYGLCVAMCEAQDCTAKYDPVTEEVGFDDSCSRSAPRILDNYNSKAGDGDPPMPCVELSCACWSEPGIDNIGGTSDACIVQDGFAGLYGTSPDTGITELAYAFEDQCIGMETSPQRTRIDATDADEYATCRDSVVKEIASRGLKC